ncbi:MAG: FAD-dependent oxidoreductase [Theionarchaea archaeon]|nr:FAD-dependent oxidoreductase [Theionarchaea archaeon]MBU7037995.1 FAD-dependent oxidoreductase [Theionarchaea archaeon]
MNVDIVVIGGGPAGLAAALSAYRAGAQQVVILERDFELGGILPQCIHDGFGNFVFGEMLTGPEYAQRYIEEIEKTGISVMLNSMVVDLDSDKKVTVVNPEEGVVTMKAKAVILAMGCRERTRSQILIPGERPSGIYTAGVAQRFINMEGLLPGKKVVVLGSGDVGLIMARRFSLEGGDVEGVYEILPRAGGLTRNVVQCLEDYGIPLHVSHTIVDIKGKERVEGVTVAQVDERFKPVPGTERYIPCDTVLLSVGLIPENELSRKATIEMDLTTGGPVVDESMETSVPGIFACGNVVHVHDLVDDVSQAAEVAGKGAAACVKGTVERRDTVVSVKKGRNVSYVVPQIIRGHPKEDIVFYLRVKEIEKNVKVIISSQGEVVKEKKERIVKPPEMVKVQMEKAVLENVNEELHFDVIRLGE